MEAIKAPNYTQLKDINGQLFEMQTKILLSDCIIDGKWILNSCHQGDQLCSTLIRRIGGQDRNCQP